jgi:predicted dithiol-disulfide oxidoreductase (DUF899 family)
MKPAPTDNLDKLSSHPPIVSREEWQRARDQLLVKEKAVTRGRDALSAERRRLARAFGRTSAHPSGAD